ncbi:hypothetical protein M8C21_013124 [Ambrosia artemisiifolia]|uniref:Morc S5 domain-containing protein n=1 Tax=Ambrosia artemisiifolia TaxID=4212 RepID=A0AAD5GJX4_AMBAR|nr:hypothetical protein M8C21_013124 [Ambrosia artemisiifolia]
MLTKSSLSSLDNITVTPNKHSKSSTMKHFRVKQEIIDQQLPNHNNNNHNNSEASVIDLDSSDDDSATHKRVKLSNDDMIKKPGNDVVLPGGFLDPLPPKYVGTQKCKNFWKAGDFEESGCDGNWDTSIGGMDHVRVHPKFLHSNATSHKWVLGAFAELLDNSLDEVCNGATYVNIDMLINKKDGNKMLVIEDNGGGMDPDKMRQCMSTQSIGLLSYTFLRSTGKEDIVVPMLDYQKDGREWKKIIRSSPGDWNTNAEAVFQWSPFSSEASLLKQFDHIKDQGTRIIIYNLWDDDQGQLELDFDTDEEDIQIRGVLEANFVEPAHDKQGFERTIVLSRLEARLIQMQKTYWRTHCHKIGYSKYHQRANKNSLEDGESSPYYSHETSRKNKAASTPPYDDDGMQTAPNLRHTNDSEGMRDTAPNEKTAQIVIGTQSRSPVVGENESTPINSSIPDLYQLMEENRKLKEKLEKNDEVVIHDLLHDLERHRNQRKALEAQLGETKEKVESLNKEQESMIDTFAEERETRDMELETLRKKLKEATAANEDLAGRVKQLELE